MNTAPQPDHHAWAAQKLRALIALWTACAATVSLLDEDTLPPLMGPGGLE